MILKIEIVPVGNAMFHAVSTDGWDLIIYKRDPKDGREYRELGFWPVSLDQLLYIIRERVTEDSKEEFEKMMNFSLDVLNEGSK